MKKIIGKSHAKINLTLDVFPQRAGESRHRVQTILHKISLADEFELVESDTFEIKGEFGCTPEENLIFKAWKLIGEFIENPRPVSVKVQKNIPIASGLGGGSSNFATFVKLYFDLFDLGEIPENLIKKSGEIGSDIPFFFSNEKCALGTHFGEVIEPLDFNFSGEVVFLSFPPEVGISSKKTKEMYGKLTNYNTNFTDRFLVEPGLEKCGNAFDEFLPEGFKGHIAGSGSSVFSFFEIENSNRYIFL
jgi:4-diphosphocytidyl-2-C-methyl-D-erythritol kinase